MTEVRTTSSTGGQKGVKNQRFDLIPVGPLMELAEHYGRGAQKYAPHQWRQGYEWSKSYSAAQRHLTAFWGGEDYDVCPPSKEGCASVTAAGEPFVTDIPNTCYNHTGSHHLVAAAWHMFGLLEFKDTHPEHDDRYIHKWKVERTSLDQPPRGYLDTVQNEEPLCGHFYAPAGFTCTRPVGHREMTELSNYPYHGYAGCFWTENGEPK